MEREEAIALGEARAKKINASYGDKNNPCEKCKGKGYIVKVDMSDTIYAGDLLTIPCDCKRVVESQKRIEESGLGMQLDRMTLQTYGTGERWQESVAKSAEMFIANPEGWYVICGITGGGKTHICTAITGELLKKGMSVGYMLWREESQKLVMNLTDYDTYDSVVSRYKAVDCLYIDDLLKGRVTDGQINLAFEILDFRYRERKTTIISTERRKADLENIDGAIFGRINQMAGRFFIDIGEKDERNYRKKTEK